MGSTIAGMAPRYPTSPDAAPEPALTAGDDPRSYAALLSAVYDAAMSGDKPPARPRSVIGDSWDRALTAGVDPDTGSSADALDAGELEGRRLGSPLTAVLPGLVRGLDVVTADGDNILVVADAEGRVLWRSGATGVLRRADRLGFIEGASWAETTVGTNAIGTALMSGRPVQVFSAEHFVRSHHSWTCAGAPIKDPRTGSVLGVVDVSGPAATIHPTTLALVDTVARLAESQLRDHHRQNLDDLRSVAAPILARSSGPALAVDVDGWVAAVDTVSPRARLSLPARLVPGRAWVNGLGECDIEPLPGGWLVRVADVDAASSSTTVRLETNSGGAVLTVVSPSGRWTHRCSPRHTEILGYLAGHRDGATASQLSAHLFGSDDRQVTVRAEISRLRKHLGGLLVANPYRFADGVVVETGGLH